MKKILFVLAFILSFSASRADYLYGTGNFFWNADSIYATTRTVFTQIGTDYDWKNFSIGDSYVLAIKYDGTLWAWGLNAYGQLGDSTTVDKSIPTKIGSDTNWEYVACGEFHSIAIKSDGTLWAWGLNAYGQLGDSTTIDKQIPTKIGSDTNWKNIACGCYHSIAIKSDGTLWTWGFNGWNQLGNATSVNKYFPTKIGHDSTWKYIAGGRYNSFGIKNNGTLWGWGKNDFGELGDGTTGNKNTPTKIGNDSTWKYISDGDDHSNGILQNGTLWAWGYGELGDSAFLNKKTPTIIGNDSTWKSISTGYVNTTLGIKNNGMIFGWGVNDYGELGDGTTVAKHSPTKIGSDSDWTNVAGGWGFSLALKAPRPLTIPLLIYPYNNSKNQITNVSFLWHKVEATSSYRIQVATDSLFANLSVNTTTKDTTYPQSLLQENTKYFWRVKAYRYFTAYRIDSSAWSDVWNFTTKINANFSSVDMGKSVVNHEKDSTVIAFIPNTSNNPITILDVNITNGDYLDFGVKNLSTPLIIPAKSAQSVTFSFTPSSLGTKTAFIKIVASDTTFTTVITGEGINPIAENVLDIIDFGKVLSGDYRDTLKVAVIKNAGTSALNISSAKIKNGSNFSVIDNLKPLIIQPNSSALISLKFSPNFMGAFADSLIIIHDGLSATSIIKLIGEGTAPKAQVSATLIDFGQVPVNGRKDTLKVAIIKNVGTAPLSINSVKIKSGAVFSIIDSLSPMILAPDSSAQISLRFSPRTSGIQRDLLLISHAGETVNSQIILQGDGISSGVDAVNPIIDFGEVKVSSHRDTILVATIQNTGKAPINISSTKLFAGIEFSIIGGDTIFSLPPDSIAKISIRYAPMTKGAVYDTLIYKHDGKGGESKIILTGVGTYPLAESDIKIIDFGDVRVNSPKDTLNVIVIKNIGTAELNINSATLKNKTEFSITSDISPKTLIPNGSAQISLKFLPTATASYSDTLTINYENNETLKIALIGNGIDSKPELQLSEIDFGKVLVGKNKDTSDVIIIKNAGKASLSIDSVKIKDASVFSITKALIPTTLKNGESANISLRFLPSSASVYGDFLLIYAKGQIFGISLKGIGIEPIAETTNKTINFGNVLVASQTDTLNVATFKNAGTADLNIASVEISPNDQGFSFIDGASSYTLAPNETRTVSIRFEPLSAGAKTANLVYHFDGLSDASILLLGNANEKLQAECLIKVDTVSGYIGQTSEIPIYILNAKDLDKSGITSFDIELSFNETILYPKNATYLESKDGREYISVNAAYKSGDSLLYVLKVIPVLGNAESTNVKIEKITPIDGTAIINTEDGEFTVLGICHDGGTRLIDASAGGKYLSIYPNPTKDKATLKFYVNKNDKISINICTELGEKVSDILNTSYDSSGIKELTVDISSLSSGMYFVVYRIGSSSVVKKLNIIR